MLLNLLVALAMGYFAPLPPLEYRVDYTVASIGFTQEETVDIKCGGDGNPLNGQIMACAEVNGERMIMPHPCLYEDDQYARLLCHELGHIRGWPKDHPNPVEYKAPQTSPQTGPKK
jgi:hypothetical protein